MTKSFQFFKDTDNRWYVDLPEWDGPDEDLEMVMGADTMLDIIAQDSDEVILSIGDDLVVSKFTLTFIREENDGGWYQLTSPHHNFEVWLCHVTKFVFGKLPNIIYVNF